MISSGEAPVVGIVRAPGADLGNLGYQRLCGGLLEQNARVVYVGGKQDVRPDANGRLESPFWEVVRGAESPSGLEVVRGVGSLAVGSMFCFRRLWDSGNVPTINSLPVRDLVESKDSFYAAFREVTAQTVAVDSNVGVVDIADRFNTTQLVIKPAIGMRGRGVEFGIAPQDLSNRLRERLEGRDAGKTLIVQEQLRQSPWPAGIRALTTEGQRMLDVATSRELRLFAVNGELYPIARADEERGYNSGQDTYVAVDPETIPDEPLVMADRVLTGIRRITCATEVAMAVDFMYGTDSENPNDPHWFVNEGNAREPSYPSPQQYEIGGPLLQARVRQAVRMAKSGKQ